ncbi:MAG: hypothetical protein ACYDBV_13115 [Nitrospiria bacterium]
MKNKLIQAVVEKLEAAGQETEQVLREGLLRMTSEGLKVLADLVGAKVE